MTKFTQDKALLLHLTQFFPENGVLIAGIGSAKLIADDPSNPITSNNPNELLAFGANNCSRQTLHFALNSVASEGTSLNNGANIVDNKFLVACKLTNKRRSNLFGTISDFFFFGNHLRLEEDDIIFVPKGSLMQGSSAGSAQIIEYEGTIQEAWIEYASKNNIPNLEYCVADQQDEVTKKSTKPLEDLTKFVREHNLLPTERTVEIHASTLLSNLEKILSFQIPFPRSEEFTQLLNDINDKYGHSFMSGQEDLMEWFKYIIEFLNILGDDSIQDSDVKYGQLGKRNIDYVNFVREKAGLPGLSQEQLIQDSNLKNNSPFLHNIAKSMGLVFEPTPERFIVDELPMASGVIILPMKDPATNTVSQSGVAAVAQEPPLKFATQVTESRTQNATPQGRSAA